MDSSEICRPTSATHRPSWQKAPTVDDRCRYLESPFRPARSDGLPPLMPDAYYCFTGYREVCLPSSSSSTNRVAGEGARRGHVCDEAVDHSAQDSIRLLCSSQGGGDCYAERPRSALDPTPWLAHSRNFRFRTEHLAGWYVTKPRQARPDLSASAFRSSPRVVDERTVAVSGSGHGASLLVKMTWTPVMAVGFVRYRVA